MKKNKNNLKEPFIRIVKRDNIKILKIIKSNNQSFIVKCIVWDTTCE